jgi:cyclohexa-1,5-dienecarbonyl-CoA hydratase
MFVDRLASVAILGLRLIDVVRSFTAGEEFDMRVNVDKKDRRLTITWDQPPLNVLDIVLLRELDEILRYCAAEPAVDVVVLRGQGRKAFSAGVDIKDHTKEKVPEMLGVVHGVIRKLMGLPQVTVAAVRGACLGGGCEVASVCDFIVAAEESWFATPEILVGCYPPVALARFTALIGYHRAAEMILTGRRFSAREAQAMGLINRVFADGELECGVESLVGELLSKSGAVMRLTVKGLRELSLRDFDASLKRAEQIYCDELLRTADVEEGVQAFLQKRPPQWSHR